MSMTPDQAAELRDLFLEARKTTRRIHHEGTSAAYAADDAAVEAFTSALRSATTT